MLFRIMTLSTLDELTEEELGISLYVVNILSPIKPPIEINARGLTWFPHDTLVKKLLDAFPLIIPEYHPIFQGLMAKLGVINFIGGYSNGEFGFNGSARARKFWII
jgi:hypothetical protein